MIMKNTKYIIFASIALIVASCSEDIFEQRNLFEKDLQNYYRNAKEVDEALIGAYSTLALGEGIGHPILIANLKSDDAFAGGGTNDIEANAIDQFINPKEDIFKAIYDRSYQGIFRVNTLLKNFNNTAFEDSVTKHTKLGEAHFLRGYLYFRVAQVFGEIPLDLDPELEYLPKASADEIYAQIATDLSMAIQHLPAVTFQNMPAAENGRATKWAAQSLMARVFLFYTGYNQKASLPTSDGGSVTKEQVVTWLEDVIANSGHMLLTDYRSIWPFSYLGDEGIDDNYPLAANVQFAGDGSAETVFAVKYSNQGIWGTTGRLAYSNQHSLYTSIRGNEYPPFGSGWGMGNVNPQLLNIFETGDIRKESTVINQATDLPGYEWNKDNNNFETGLYNKKYNAVVLRRNNQTVGMYYFLYSGQNQNNQLWNMQDDIIIRFADVLLMAAELGSNSQVYFDRVRARAFAPNPAPALAYSLENLKLERRRELALEGIRYYDLLRWGDAQAAINSANGTVDVRTAGVPGKYTISFDPARAFSPLPESQIRVSQGNLVQNPAWQ
jgi:hypothetical protein